MTSTIFNKEQSKLEDVCFYYISQFFFSFTSKIESIEY